jgi:hypothetical protein
MTTEKRSLLLALLQDAIDEAITTSDRIGDIVDEMKDCGYELSLMLQTTITITPSEDNQKDDVPEPQLSSTLMESNGDIHLTDQDLAFLQELNIAVGA